MISGKQLKALLRTLRDQGVVSFEHDGVKIILDPHFQSKGASVAKIPNKGISLIKAPAEDAPPLIPMPEMTDEHWLLSTNLSDPTEVPN